MQLTAHGRETLQSNTDLSASRKTVNSIAHPLLCLGWKRSKIVQEIDIGLRKDQKQTGKDVTSSLSSSQSDNKEEIFTKTSIDWKNRNNASINKKIAQCKNRRRRKRWRLK